MSAVKRACGKTPFQETYAWSAFTRHAHIRVQGSRAQGLFASIPSQQLQFMMTFEGSRAYGRG